MLSEAINKLETASMTQPILVLIKKGKLEVIDVANLPLDSSSNEVLGDYLTSIVNSINDLKDAIKTLKTSQETTLEALNTMGACTTQLSKQIEVLNEEVFK